MKNRKGFTLIELLAVIVILAIIALIAVPQVLKILNQARVSAAEDSTYGIYNATQDYISKVMIDNGGNFPGGDLTFTCNNNGNCTLDNYSTLVSEGFVLEEKLDYKGKQATDGKIKITNNGTDITIENIKVSGFYCNHDGDRATCSKDKGESSENNNMSPNVLTMDQMCPNCVYRFMDYFNNDHFNIGDTISEGEYVEDYHDVGHEIFIGFILDSESKITRAFACGIEKNKPFCIEGYSTESSVIEKNRNILTSVFGDTNDSTENNGCIVDEYNGIHTLMCSGDDIGANSGLNNGWVDTWDFDANFMTIDNSGYIYNNAG